MPITKNQKLSRLIFMLAAVATVVVNLVLLADAFERKDDFGIFRRIIYIIVFTVIATDYYIKYRATIPAEVTGDSTKNTQQ